MVPAVVQLAKSLLPAPSEMPIVWTHHFCFSFLLCKSILFTELIQKQISKLRRCFLITSMTGGTYGADKLKLN